MTQPPMKRRFVWRRLPQLCTENTTVRGVQVEAVLGDRQTVQNDFGTGVTPYSSIRFVDVDGSLAVRS